MKSMKIWKTIIAIAAACFAGGLWQTTAQETAEPEMLEIRSWYSNIHGADIEEALQVHEDMGRFLVAGYIRIPAAKDLIRNREPDDDGVFRIPIPLGYESDVKEFTIEVHGVAPQIWVSRQEGGVKIVWDRGQLLSAPSIDGPWTDITFNDTRRLFLRSSSPAEFFRVKPE